MTKKLLTTLLLLISAPIFGMQVTEAKNGPQIIANFKHKLSSPTQITKNDLQLAVNASKKPVMVNVMILKEVLNLRGKINDESVINSCDYIQHTILCGNLEIPKISDQTQIILKLKRSIDALIKIFNYQSLTTNSSVSPQIKMNNTISSVDD